VGYDPAMSWLLLAAALADEPDETVIVESGTSAQARQQIVEALEDEGYHRVENHGDYLLLLPDEPWKPRVRVYDEGYVVMRHQPTRFKPPGNAFADEANPAEWALCVVAVWACVDRGTRLTSLTDARVVDLKRDEVAREIAEETAVFRDRVVAERMQHRLSVELPAQCEAIWAEPIPAADRRRKLFELWNSRTETPEGEVAREVIRAFLSGVVQTSGEPFTAEEIAAYDAARTVGTPFAP
jgi:hypothetical protein